MLELITNINEKGVFADKLARDRIAEELQIYKGKSVTITISDARKISKNQYHYLHGVIYPLIQKQYKLDKVDDGRAWNKDEMHYFFCSQFLGKKEYFNPLTGESLGEKQLTTSDLKMRSMALEFMENVISWAGLNMNISIPAPDKDWRENKTLILSE